MRDKLNKIAGFSLVELMVAVTVALLLAAGVLHFAVSNSRSFRMQQDIIHIQERARFISRFLSYQIRMAGQWGSLDTFVFGGSSPAITEKGDCDAAWAFDGESELFGYDGRESFSDVGFPEDCVNSSDYISESDSLVVRFAGAQPISFASMVDDQVYWRLVAGREGTFVYGEDVDKTAADDPDVLYYPYDVSMFVVRPCYLTESNEGCNATDDGGEPIPTLVRYHLEGNKVSVERIMEGVEQMQIDYGVVIKQTAGTEGICWVEADQMDDVLTDCSVAADRVPGWEDVAFVRFALIVRSRDKDTSNQFYSFFHMLRDKNTYTPEGVAKQYRRKLITRTVKLRNRFIKK